MSAQSSALPWQGQSVLVVGPSELRIDWQGTSSGAGVDSVPTVDVTQRQDAPGGAAEVALQLLALGLKPTLVTAVGTDSAGQRLQVWLDAAGLAYQIVEGPTATDERLWNGHRLVAAWSTGGAIAWTQAQSSCRWEELEAAGPVVWICDRQTRDSPVLVEPWFCWCRGALNAGLRGQHLYWSSQRDGLTQEASNLLETYQTTFKTVVSHQATGIAGVPLLPMLDRRLEGTVVSALVAGFVNQLSVEDAIETAQKIAQASYQGQLQSPYWQQLLQGQPKLAQRESLAALMANHRERGQKVVFTNGCFDLLHPGHVTYLQQARALGDLLIVAVNDDESVRGLKGTSRPINPIEDRLAVLAGLGCVDYVIPFGEPTPQMLLELAQPDIYVKGGDYTPETLAEAPLVRALGGEIRILPFVQDRSTTAIVQRIRRS